MSVGQRDLAAALTLIEESVVMTLAVTARDGPWAAPVYYVYRPADKGFYFLSSPDSRHVREALASGSCAATIFKQTDTADDTAWRNIRGLQMRGGLTPAGGLEATRALARYLRRFPFSRTLLPAGGDHLTAFRQQLGVRLYRFSAATVEWTDNRIHFGYRCDLTL